MITNNFLNGQGFQKPKRHLEVINLDESPEKKPHEAWKNQRERQKEHIPTPQDILETALCFEQKQHRALFIIAYLTAGRISELVRYKYRKYPSKKVYIIKNGKKKKRRIADYAAMEVGEVQPGLTRRQVQQIESGDKRVLLLRIRNLKNKTKKEKDIPITIDNPSHKEMLKIFVDYINDLLPHEELFPFEYHNAWRIISASGYNCHFLRHIRLTHLVTLYDFTDQQLKIFAGWSDSRPSKSYIEANWADLIKKL